MSPTVGSFCSGIDGLGLGLQRAGFRIVWQSEVDDYCARVLAEQFHGVPNLGDVTAIDWSRVERPDLICGGYPCQPFSYGGSRRGVDDSRHLWPYLFDAIRVLRPRAVLIENVPGHLSLGFDTVLADLASIGFDAEWSLVPACAFGAPHTRERLFCVAYPSSPDEPSEVSCDSGEASRRDWWPESRGSRRDESGTGWWVSEPDVDRMADGIPRAVVRGPLEALGNAVVPQVAEFIGRQLMGVLL